MITERRRRGRRRGEEERRKERRVMREWRVIEEVRVEAEGVKIPADFKSSQV